MANIQYGCKGSCGNAITEEQYNEGNHVCQTDGCTHFGQPLSKKIVCEKCGEIYFEGEEHTCSL